jgi:signal transduction histidine kinase
MDRRYPSPDLGHPPFGPTASCRFDYARFFLKLMPSLGKIYEECDVSPTQPERWWTLQEEQIRLHLHAIGAEIAEGSPREIVFARIVEAVQELGFDRVRLDLLSADKDVVESVAVHGFNCNLGCKIPVAEDKDLARLRVDTRPQIFIEPYTYGCVPILLRGELIGKLSVDNVTSARSLGIESLEEIILFAHQAAFAQATLAEPKTIRQRAAQAAHESEASRRKSAYLEAVSEVSKVITLQLGRPTLAQITQIVIKQMFNSQDHKAVLGALHLYDETSDELILESIYSSYLYSDLVQRLGERQPLRTSLAQGIRIGIVGRVMISGKPQLVADVRNDCDYIQFYSATISEMAVPLMDRNLGKTIGVFNVESDRAGAFDGEDLDALRCFAELAVIAIQNTHQMEELHKQTTLASLGLGSAVAHHQLSGQIGVLRNQVYLLEKALHANPPSLQEASDILTKIDQNLVRVNIWRAAGQVDEGVNSILVNEQLVGSFLNQFLEKNEFLWTQRLTTSFGLSFTARVSVNLEWIFRVLDILMENAIRADAHHIILGSRPSRRQGSWAEIYVADDGNGIARRIRDRLFREPIKSTGGLGLGLLIAQEIVKSYGGSIGFEDRTPRGTIMTISLPLEDGS